MATVAGGQGSYWTCNESAQRCYVVAL